MGCEMYRYVTRVRHHQGADLGNGAFQAEWIATPRSVGGFQIGLGGDPIFLRGKSGAAHGAAKRLAMRHVLGESLDVCQGLANLALLDVQFD